MMSVMGQTNYLELLLLQTISPEKKASLTKLIWEMTAVQQLSQIGLPCFIEAKFFNICDTKVQFGMSSAIQI